MSSAKVEQAKERAARVRARRDAYRATFLHPSSPKLLGPAAIVIADLRTVCCGDAPTVAFDRTGRLDPHTMAWNEGKRYVWLRIQQALNIDDAKLERMLAATIDQEEAWPAT